MSKYIKTLEEIKDIINQHRQELEDKFKVKSIAIFGSYYGYNLFLGVTGEG